MVRRLNPDHLVRSRACYASTLGDCRGPVSREHYISKSLLEEIGKKILIRGLPGTDGFQ